MPSIITLQGPPDSGKSTSIGMLLKSLPQQFNTDVILPRFRPNSIDFFTIVQINGVLVGITSYGDSYNLITQRCQPFIVANCQIIICACHLEGRTVDAVNNIALQGYTWVHSIQKQPTTENLRLQSDQAAVDAILGQISESFWWINRFGKS
jgi:hypothetical protein